MGPFQTTIQPIVITNSIMKIQKMLNSRGSKPLSIEHYIIELYDLSQT